MRELKVDGGMPSSCAAPSAPATRQPVRSSARSVLRRSSASRIGGSEEMEKLLLIIFIIYYFRVIVNFFYVNNQVNQQSLEVVVLQIPYTHPYEDDQIQVNPHVVLAH